MTSLMSFLLQADQLDQAFLIPPVLQPPRPHWWLACHGPSAL